LARVHQAFPIGHHQGLRTRPFEKVRRRFGICGILVHPIMDWFLAELPSGVRPVKVTDESEDDPDAGSSQSLRSRTCRDYPPSRLDHTSQVGASSWAMRPALMSNARSLPSSRTAVGQIEGRMLDHAGWRHGHDGR